MKNSKIVDVLISEIHWELLSNIFHISRTLSFLRGFDFELPHQRS